MFEKLVWTFADWKLELSSLDPALKVFWDEFEIGIGWKKFSASSKIRQLQLVEAFLSQTLSAPGEDHPMFDKSYEWYWDDSWFSQY